MNYSGNDTKLYYKKDAQWKELTELVSAPEQGATPNKIAVSKLSGAYTVSIKGKKELPEYEFVFNLTIDKNSTDDSYSVLRAMEVAGTKHEFVLELANGYGWKYTNTEVSVKVGSIEEDGVMQFTATLYLGAEPTEGFDLRA